MSVTYIYICACVCVCVYVCMCTCICRYAHTLFVLRKEGRPNSNRSHTTQKHIHAHTPTHKHVVYPELPSSYNDITRMSDEFKSMEVSICIICSVYKYVMYVYVYM